LGIIKEKFYNFGKYREVDSTSGINIDFIDIIENEDKVKNEKGSDVKN